MNKEVEIFVKKYNNSNIQPKYKFELVENNYYAWIYEVCNIKLFIMIKSVTETKVKLWCKRTGKNFIPIEIVEPSYSDIYNAVYKFLIESVENTEALIRAEANMKF